MKVFEPLSRILNEAIEVFQMEENALEYNEVAPSTQHEEDNHKFLASKLSKLYEYFDPERPLFQQKGDIGPLLQLPAVTFEDSVEMIADKMCDEEYRKHLRSLNQSQYECFTHTMHVAATKDKQETCCLHGGAGTGKSHVLKALYQGLYCTLCTEAGQSRDSYKILVMAPTGKAAYNVKGTTIHSALHIPANHSLHEYKCLSVDVLNMYQMKYRDLEWILCDEISMVSNDLWKYVHLCLQDIKHSREPFGGVSIIAIGDLYQLQPVKGMFIFMDLRHNYGPIATNLWCEYFTMYELGEIMHQKDDKEFAELLNRLHIGKHTTDDLNLLSSRTTMEEQKDQLSDIPYFFPTRKMVARYNDMVLQNTMEQKITITAIDIPPNDISPKFREQLHTAIDK